MVVSSVIMYSTAVVCAAAILVKSRKTRTGAELYALAIIVEIVLVALSTFLYTPGTGYNPLLDICHIPLLIIAPLLYWLAISRMADTSERGRPFMIVVLSVAVMMTIVYAAAVLSDVKMAGTLYMTTRGELPQVSDYPGSYHIIRRLDTMAYYLELCVSLVTQVYVLTSFLSYKKAILDTFSDPESKSLPEMYLLIITLIAKTLVIIAISTPIFSFIRGWAVPLRDITTTLFFIAQAVVICRMKYSAVELRELYNAKKNGSDEDGGKVADSPYASLIEEKLSQLIEERFYTQKDINAVDLSLQIGVNREYLSKYIRFHYNETFSSFVSRLRVEYAKALLSESDNRVAEVGEKVGFGNVSTFYRNFTAIVGCSPKDWWQKKH